MTEASEGQPRAPRGFVDHLRGQPRWKIVALCLAGLCAVGGGLFWLAAGDAPPPVAGGSGGSSALLPNGAGSSFLPGGSGTGTGGGSGGGGAATAEEPAAKGVFRLGFSFVAGFCIGAFVRSALKIAAIAVGFCLVVVVLLENSGFLTVEWQAIDTAWNGFWARVGEEWSSFERFLTGRLPAAGLATFGLVTGFRRR